MSMERLRKFIEKIETYHMRSSKEERDQKTSQTDTMSQTSFQRMQLDEILSSMYMTTTQLESLFFELEKEEGEQAFDHHAKRQDDFMLKDEIRYIVEQVSLISLA